MKLFLAILVTMIIILTTVVLDAQAPAKFKSRAAIAETLAAHMGESLNKLEAALTQAELDKVEAAILDTTDDEKRAVLERAKTFLESVKATDAVTAVDAELGKLTPKEEPIIEGEPK